MPLAKSATLELFAVSPTSMPNSLKDTDPASGDAIYLVQPPFISKRDIAAVQRGEEADGMPPSLTVHLTPAGSAKLAAATTPATGQQVAVVVNGEVISVPQVQSPLSNSFVVTGDWTLDDFNRLFDTLTGP